MNLARAALPACTQYANLVDQFAAERSRGSDFASGFRFRDVVGGSQRKGSQADLGVTAGEGRGHDYDQIALLREQARQRGDPVDIRHVDVKYDDVGLGPLDLFDGLATA